MLQPNSTTDKALCVEFILHEYARILSMVEQIALQPADDRLELIDRLLNQPMNVFLANPMGLIDKLCFYCEALVQISRGNESLLIMLDELRNGVVWLRRFPFSNERLEKVRGCIAALFDKMEPELRSCICSETVLFALLELRKIFNQHLGHNKVEELLQRMFPEGPQQLRRSIINGFARRGFGDFCIQHKSLLEEVTWSALPGMMKLSN
jgi:hypothetical protein